MAVLYGIKSCDSCRKALKWLGEQGVDARLHDFRAHGLEISMLERWCDTVGWESIMNKRSLTWRRIPEADRLDLDRNKAIALMLEHPTLVKRPVLEHGAHMHIGFTPEGYKRLLARKA